MSVKMFDNDGGCEWVLTVPEDWHSIPAMEAQEGIYECGQYPAPFEVWNQDGCDFHFCAEHYDAFMRGELDPIMGYDMEEFPNQWRDENGNLYEETDFEPEEE
jgi:hypothetical protein